ncbi:MAG: sigma-70 family RNA polymerase sigma factor [Planctomycetes bacterium]|nr:sigma-70 family RNA polymerase sigma factor [Planctomycetota bacterium]
MGLVKEEESTKASTVNSQYRRGKVRVSAIGPEGELEILRRIAEDRDHSAFRELYERVSGPAYNLALHFTRNAGMAEEAVQSAMIRIWRHAKSCRDENPRAWILRTVANESLRVLKRKRMHEMILDDDSLKHARLPGDEKVDKMEHLELREALRREVGRLPVRTREIVTLYFGANLSQSEITDLLEIPQTTVSLRLREALDHLRSALAGAGFAAAAPGLAPEMLNEALLSGQPVPAGMCEKILERIGDAADSAQEISRRVSQNFSRRVAPGASKNLILAAVVAVAAGAGAVWLTKSDSQDEPRAQTPVEVQETQPIEQAKGAVGSIHRRWRFSEGPLPGIEEYGSAWKWMPAEDGRPAGMLAAQSGSRSCMRLPLAVPRGLSWEVVIHAYQLPLKPGNVLNLNAGWGVRQTPEAITSFRGEFFVHKNGGPIETVNYLVGEGTWSSTAYWSGSRAKRMGVVIDQFDEGLEILPFLTIGATGCIVTEIEVREIRKEDIPEPFGDIDRCAKAFNLKRVRLNKQQAIAPRTLARPLEGDAGK